MALWREGNFTNSGSSRPSWAQQDEANLKMDLGGLELKLNVVLFAVKNWTVKCIKSSFQPNVKEEPSKYTKPSLRGSLRVDIGEEPLKMPFLNSAT